MCGAVVYELEMSASPSNLEYNLVPSRDYGEQQDTRKTEDTMVDMLHTQKENLTRTDDEGARTIHIARHIPDIGPCLNSSLMYPHINAPNAWKEQNREEDNLNQVKCRSQVTISKLLRTKCAICICIQAYGVISYIEHRNG
ncbi:unnamed protein product [Cylicocyclus nassatus]|uniref:Uncharacterized protein n=1 Tax=Cylicocyclus nassatus TaxID=53992 RepID=A0AA36HB78_CYLNA|nr:unnamed protein product [Cylicocyclus nassatus]